MVTSNTNNPSPPGQGPPEFDEVFALYRDQSFPAGRVVTGRLRAGLAPEAPPVERLLAGWPGPFTSREGPHGWELLLFEPAERRERWWLHGLLFALTLFSTTVAGSLLAGLAPVGFGLLPTFNGWWLPLPLSVDLPALRAGLPFGLALVAILALHEAGHYIAARYHRISVTPPYFVPFPPYLSIIGTLGAFIRMRSPVMSRSALLDVAVAGPLVSFAASLPLLWWGLSRSLIVAVPAEVPSSYLLGFAGEHFWLGGSLAMDGLARLVAGFAGSGQVLALHPIAFAGWLGLFVTALNLLPISQLDGGHILYAVFGSRQRLLAWAFFLALIPLGWLWPGWWVWAALVFVIGRGRIAHPPLFSAEQGPAGARVAYMVAAAVVFILCFIPVPFRL